MASRGDREVNNVINVFNIFVISGDESSSTDVRKQVRTAIRASEAVVQEITGSSSRGTDSRVSQQTSRNHSRIQDTPRQVQPKLPNISPRKPSTVHIKEISGKTRQVQHREVRKDQPKLPNVTPLKPSVVHIKGSGSTGTGFIVKAERQLVLTNMHVLGGSKNPEVTIFDEQGKPKSYQAKLVAYSRTLDLALLVLVHCYDKGLTAVRFGSSQSLKVMQPVFTIGDPFNVGTTVVSGSISALPDHPITVGKIKIDGAIQLDANINEGNSGGPLFNMDCKVIGVVYSGFSGSGIAYAIPADTVTQWMEKCLQQVDDKKLNAMTVSTRP